MIEQLTHAHPPPVCWQSIDVAADRVVQIDAAGFYQAHDGSRRELFCDRSDLVQRRRRGSDLLLEVRKAITRAHDRVPAPEDLDRYGRGAFGIDVGMCQGVNDSPHGSNRRARLADGRSAEHCGESRGDSERASAEGHMIILRQTPSAVDKPSQSVEHHRIDD